MLWTTWLLGHYWPRLILFDPSLPTELHTDASTIGYGGILIQKQEGNTRVIGYFSKRTLKFEEHYHSYELETLAVVNSLRHFRVYLLGIHFTLVTDCNAIKSTATKKDILSRVARWWIYMQDFNFIIFFSQRKLVAPFWLFKSKSNSAQSKCETKQLALCRAERRLRNDSVNQWRKIRSRW